MLVPTEVLDDGHGDTKIPGRGDSDNLAGDGKSHSFLCVEGHVPSLFLAFHTLVTWCWSWYVEERH